MKNVKMDKNSSILLRNFPLFISLLIAILLLVVIFVLAADSSNIAVDCYDETAVAACTAAQRAAINTSGGTTYEFDKNTGDPIRVSFKNESGEIGTITDCQVYVTGLDDDPNTWTLQLGNWSTATYEAGSGQTSPEVEGTLNWTCTGYFGTADDESLFDDFSVRISTDDGGGPSSGYLDFIRVNITYSENAAPVLKLNNTYPESPSPDDDLKFNITCTDSDAGDTITGYVGIYNGSTLFKNHSATVNNDTETTLWTVGSGNTSLGEIWNGSYWCGDATVNSSKDYDNVTISLDSFAPVVNINVSLNNTEFTINNPTIDFNFTDLNSGTADCILYFNDTQKAQNTSALNWTQTSLTASGSNNGRYDVYINCSDGTNVNKSGVLNISINVDWVNDDLDSCRNITITNSGSETLTNFPAYINLTYDNDMQADFTDIRFYNAECRNGGAQLDYEIENYTASTRAHVWVRIPSLTSAGTTISVYYNNNTGVTSGENASGVWDRFYKAAYHMTEINVTDSTSNQNNGTQSGGVTNKPDKRIDGVNQFDGSNDYINVSDSASLDINLTLTISAWIYKNSTPAAAYDGIVAKGYDDANAWAYTLNTYQDELDFLLYNGGYKESVTSAANLQTHTWYYVAVTYNNLTNNVSFYVNGKYEPSTGDAHQYSIIHNNYPLALGELHGITSLYNGSMDEVRVSNTTRSASWINMSYLIVNNHTDYVSYGDEESRTGDTTAPVVFINVSLNNTEFTIGTPTIDFNFTDSDSGTANCTLYFNDTAYNYTTGISNSTQTTLTVNTSLSNGRYDVYINCTDESDNTNQSGILNVSIGFIFDVTPHAWAYFSNDDYWVVGTTSVDVSGGIQRNGTISGATTGITNAILGEAFRFDGDDDYVETTATLDVGSDFSYCMWANVTEDGQYIAGTDKDNTLRSLMQYGDAGLGGTSQRFSCSYYDGNYDFAIDTENSNTNTYYHVCCVIDVNSYVGIIVNGVSKANTSTGTAGALAREFSYGRTVSTTLNGTIDEVMVWNMSINTTYAQTLYNGGSGYNPFAGDESPPNVYLSNPLDDNTTDDNTPDFTFWYTDDLNGSLRCDLLLNETGYGFNASTTNSTNTTITANETLDNGDYNWSVECDDGPNTGKSSGRNISIQAPKAPDSPTVNYPVHGQALDSKTTSVTLNITITDQNEDYMNVTFTNNDTETVICNNNTNIASGSNVQCLWSGLSKGVYYWKVNVTDGNLSVEEIYNFTIETVIHYRYQLSINYTDSIYDEHILQPFTVNISNLNGTNKAATKVKYNDSGSFVDVSWEWHHERKNITDEEIYVDDTIRFLVNLTNNTVENNYWIYTYTNVSRASENTTLFMWYDGFELGDVNGWADDGCTFAISGEANASGSYGLNYSSGALNEVYFNWSRSMTVDSEDLHICLFAQINIEGNGDAFPVMLQKNVPSYDGGWNRLETWFYDKPPNGDRPNQTIQMYNGTTSDFVVTEVFNYEQWYSWCWKDINTTDPKDGESHFYIDNNDTEPAGSDWFQTDGNSRDYNITVLNTINPLPPEPQAILNNSLSSIGGISLSSTSGATDFEFLIDEIYISNSTDYNMYLTTPEFVIGEEEILITCTYSGGGDFNVNCVHNCNFSLTDMGQNEVFIDGSGFVQGLHNITNASRIRVSGGCRARAQE